MRRATASVSVPGSLRKKLEAIAAADFDRIKIVEHHGGNRGHGAPNAPDRLAARRRRLRPKGVPRS